MTRKAIEPGVYRRAEKSGSIVYDVRYRDGNGVRRWESGYTRIQDARDALSKKKSEARRARAGLQDEDSQASLIAPLVTEYHDYTKTRGSEVYVSNTRRNVDLVCSLIKRARISDIRPFDLERAREQILRTVSKRTANDKIAAFMSFLRWCEKTQRIARSPVQHFDPIPVRSADIKRNRASLTFPQVDRLISVARKEDSELGENRVPQAPLLELMRWTGARQKEILLLRWSDVVVEVGLASIVIRPTSSKTDKLRISPIPVEMYDALLDLRARVESVCGAKAKSQDLIFKSATGVDWGTMKSRRNLLRWLDRIIDRAAAEDVANNVPESDRIQKTLADGKTIDWYALRHTFATHMREADISKATAQAMLGHMTEGMTDNYTESERTDKRAALAKLEEKAAEHRRS